MALDQYQEEEEGMSFLDHLEALRWHLLRAVTAVLIFTVVAFIAKDFVFGVLILGPSKVDFLTYRVLCELGNFLGIPALCINELPFTLQSRQMTGQFSMHMTASMVVGLIAAFPYLFYEVWKFISPGLYAQERNAARGAVFFVSFLFLSGASFGYFVLSPLSINFLANYQLDSTIANEFDITSYVSTLSMLVLASAIMFQLPVVVYFLSMSGLVTSKMLQSYRRHSIVVILILGAVITPSGDPFSLTVISLPLYILFEISIYISSVVVKNKLKEEEAQLRADQQNL